MSTSLISNASSRDSTPLGFWSYICNPTLHQYAQNDNSGVAIYGATYHLLNSIVLQNDKGLSAICRDKSDISNIWNLPPITE